LKKRILIYSQSDLSRDPRVVRQIDLLREDYIVETAGLAPSFYQELSFLDLRDRIRLRRGKGLLALLRYFFGHGIEKGIELSLYWTLLKMPAFNWLKVAIEIYGLKRRTLRSIRRRKYDLVIANDLSALAICSLSKNGKFLYDAHEFSPGQYVHRRSTLPARSFVDYQLRRFLPACDVITTVSKGIAEKYHCTYEIDPPEIITNAPRFEDLEPIYRNDGVIRLVHHGAAIRSRAIETLITAVLSLDERFEFDLFLVRSDPVYYKELVGCAAGSRRVHFLDPVPMKELPSVLNAYDIGLYSLPPTTLNQKYALPNKIFEYVQSRIGVAIGPSIEMAEYVKRYRIGVVAMDFSPKALASALSSIDAAAIRTFKANSHIYARELSADSQMAKLKQIVETLVEPSPRRGL